MKNLPLILSIIALIATGILLALSLTGKLIPAKDPVVVTQRSAQGLSIAHVNADTLDAKYEWLAEQRKIIEERIRNAERNLIAKEDALRADMAAFQKKYESGNFAPAELEGEYNALLQRQQRLQEEGAKLAQNLAQEQQVANNELMAKLEEKLKTLQDELGYDYILSYSKGGGQVLLANDSLDITVQVLELLNAKEEADLTEGSAKSGSAANNQ